MENIERSWHQLSIPTFRLQGPHSGGILVCWVRNCRPAPNLLTQVRTGATPWDFSFCCPRYRSIFFLC